VSAPSPSLIPMPSPRTAQLSFLDLGTDLRDVTFVVLDLETTGGRAGTDTITEIGAVKARGGEVLAEFQTLIDPRRPIPAYIATLTGITDAMVAGAPTLDTALPMFLDWIGDAVLVAHNARFDLGFLRAECAARDLAWTDNRELDTLALARRELGRDEVANHKLGTLAAHVGATTVPNHRALSDARATLDVLWWLLERMGPRGVTTLEDLSRSGKRPSAVQQRQRSLAEGLPDAPGVYQFVAEDGEVLYVGKAVSIARRVATYFTAAETRRPVLDMLPVARSVRPVVCATEIEASVRELRMITELAPRANRRSKNPRRVSWLKLSPSGELLRTVRTVADDEDRGAAYIGPLASAHQGGPIRELVTASLLSPQSVFERAPEVGPDVRARVRRVLLESPDEVVTDVRRRLAALAGAERFEQAARLRDTALAYLRAAERARSLRALAAAEEIVAARPAPPGRAGRIRWELVCVRRGRLAGSATVTADRDPVVAAEALATTSATVDHLVAPLCWGYHEEAELLLDWLGAPDCRIVALRGTWAVPFADDFARSALTRDYAGNEHPAERTAT
jgi:DNA polymerase III subunit epsilon